MALTTVDDMLRQRAAHINSRPFLAYSKSVSGLTDFESFTAKDVDQFVDNAISPQPPVIAILGLSNRDYVISMFALSRLGYTLLLLSPRLSPEIYQSLLEKAQCKTVIYELAFISVVESLQMKRILPILPRAAYDKPLSTRETFRLDVDPSIALNRTAYIMHSSGSTGIPKLIFQTHQACLENYRNSGNGKDCLLTAPLYHTHGHATLHRELGKNGTIFLYNSSLPLTSANLLAVMDHIQPQIVFAVPYVLKLLAETQSGVDALARCELVSSSGSRCPDDLGNLLVGAGVHLVSLFGSTETGQLLSSRRPRESRVWDYMNLIPSVKPYIWMKPLDGETYELVALDGLKSKVESNSDEPPNSFHTRDIFTPHPELRDAWKYIGRLDDRITLVNGEKVLPLPIEGRIRQDPLVREAVVFGIEKDVPGLLLFRSEAARNLSDQEFVKRIWPAVKDANSRAEGFSQISQEFVLPFGTDVVYPQTDKGTIIRAQVYRQFATEMERLYKSLNQQIEGELVLTLQELEAYLLEIFDEALGVHLPDTSSDFFSAGLDSLNAIKVVTVIKKTLYLGGRGNKLTQNELFQRGNAKELAQFLLDLREGDVQSGPDTEGGIALMKALIDKYSIFVKHRLYPEQECLGRSVVLTGATGSLGAHILAQLTDRDDISSIYCLVRASNSSEALQRISSALSERALELSHDALKKINAIPSDIQRHDLGVTPERLQKILSETTTIIHAAWAVNFNLSLRSFEQHIKATQNLINLSLSVGRPAPARLVFCSSISTAMGLPRKDPVPEAPIENVAKAQSTGYAQSKLVTEHIVQRAVEKGGADGCILRIGQIVGDTKAGFWNPSESIPLMISTAEEIGLPDLAEEECSWLPVDTVAKACIEIARLSSCASPSPNSGSPTTQQLVYNIVHPRPFRWNPDLIQALRDAGLRFETVTSSIWVQRLVAGDQNPERNPAVKLSSFFADKYGGSGRGAEPRVSVKFSTENAEKESSALRGAPDLVKDGLIFKFVDQWRKVWVNNDEPGTKRPSSDLIWKECGQVLNGR